MYLIKNALALLLVYLSGIGAVKYGDDFLTEAGVFD